MGPGPAPLVPDWEPFSRDNGFVQIVLAEVPCNWFQCQENSIDPVHFEWMHENWGNRLRHGQTAGYGPKHIRLAFEEFEYGFVYKRIRENTDESSPYWTVGRTALWPNCFFLGEHFEWRVPIDDENTLSVVWKYTHVPKDREPYVQEKIPAWTGPFKDEQGNWITSHVMNQDFVAWAGQGRIADRTQESLNTSDRGIVMMRKRFFEQLEKMEAGEDPKGLIRDPAKNVCVPLPAATQHVSFNGLTSTEIMADPVKRVRFTSYIFQAGQPDHVKRAFEQAMGIEMQEFEGLPVGKPGS
jgi:5,5'-dehydrodivanillate O-demethylase